jgi:hypothetical protein
MNPNLRHCRWCGDRTCRSDGTRFLPAVTSSSFRGTQAVSNMDIQAMQSMDWLFKKERIYLLAQFWQQVSPAVTLLLSVKHSYHTSMCLQTHDMSWWVIHLEGAWARRSRRPHAWITLRCFNRVRINSVIFRRQNSSLIERNHAAVSSVRHIPFLKFV